MVMFAAGRRFVPPIGWKMKTAVLILVRVPRDVGLLVSRVSMIMPHAASAKPTVLQAKSVQRQVAKAIQRSSVAVV